LLSGESVNKEQPQHLVKADFELALQLASEPDYLFENRNSDAKRLLCDVIYKHLKVKEDKIMGVDYNSPFGFIAA